MQYINLRSFLNMILNRAEIKLQRNYLVSRPLEITLEPTLKCNSDCIMCNRNFNRGETKAADGFLSWDTFRKVEPLFKYAERVLFGGFGESLLHPDYMAMLKEIKKSGPFVYFFTNGILMTEDVGKELVNAEMDMICISMGGATRETFKKIRGVDAFDKVVDNIRRLKDYKREVNKKKPSLSFNIVAMKSVLPELQSIVQLAYELEVESIMFPNLVVQGQSLDEESLWHDPETAKAAFGEAAVTARKLGIDLVPPKLDVCRNDCTSLFKIMAVNWDGSVMSCALERFIVGQLGEDNVNAIWNGKGIQKLRREYFSKGLQHICPNCDRWDNRPEVFLSPPRNSRAFAKRI